MNINITTPRASLDYEEWYHKERHNNHFNDVYYNARAKISLVKFFKGFDLNSRILDYGCGLGQNILLLPNAIGCDISSFGVEFCKTKGIEATTDFESLERNSFDIVLSTHVLEHHPHPKTMIEDIYTLLKKNGTFILVIPHEKHRIAKVKKVFGLDLNQHLYAWNFQAINNLLITSGFEIRANKYVRGAGYHKLLPLLFFGFPFYLFFTNLISRLLGIKELMIVAQKK